MHEKECTYCVDYSYFIKPNENVNLSKICVVKLKHLDPNKQKHCIEA